MKTEKQPFSDQITEINVKNFNGSRFLHTELSYAEHHWHALKPSFLLFLQFLDETQSTENYATLIFFITIWQFLATDCPKNSLLSTFSKKKQIFVLPGYSIEQHRWFKLFHQFPRVTFFLYAVIGSAAHVHRFSGADPCVILYLFCHLVNLTRPRRSVFLDGYKKLLTENNCDIFRPCIARLSKTIFKILTIRASLTSRSK